MSEIGRWAERLYAETDVGRSIATSFAGVVGLLLYLLLGDWVIAAFSLLIVFPLAHVISEWLHGKVHRRLKRRLKESEWRDVLKRLTKEEREVIRAFIDAGGATLTWSHVNGLALPGPAIESLISRSLLATSVTSDGLRETFVLDADLFDVALQTERTGTEK